MWYDIALRELPSCQVMSCHDATCGSKARPTITPLVSPRVIPHHVKARPVTSYHLFYIFSILFLKEYCQCCALLAG